MEIALPGYSLSNAHLVLSVTVCSETAWTALCFNTRKGNENCSNALPRSASKDIEEFQFKLSVTNKQSVISPINVSHSFNVVYLLLTGATY